MSSVPTPDRPASAPTPNSTDDPSGPPPWAAWLALHTLVWTLVAWLSRSNLDLAGDMVENYVWGIEWQAGYAKHPPLFAWITAAWFSVMPRADWAYFALSALNATVGLLGIGALARRYLPLDAAVVAVAALAITPLYTGLAIKFNANAVQLSVWPWAAFHFVAFMQGGRRRNALACGALAALALLGKYFSVVLVLALVLVSLAVPAWRQRLRGAGPWLALAAGAAALAPHVAWLVDQQFMTLRYASQRSEGQFGAALLRLLNYGGAQLGYLLPGAALLVAAVRSGERRAAARWIARSLVRPTAHPELWWLALAPMIVVGGIAVTARTPMASVWGMAQWFAVTALWLAVLRRNGIEPRVRWLGRALPVYWAVVLVIAAGVGFADARRAAPAAVEPRAELAHAVHALWRERTGRELRIVGGSGADSMSVAFYAPGRTRWWSPASPALTPWITAADWQREGGLVVCTHGDAGCQAAAQAFSPEAPVEISVRKRAWGQELPARAYKLYLQPPG